MALPLTGLTISALSQETGIASSNLGEIFCSESINEYGFNCPDADIQGVLWGATAAYRATLNTATVLKYPKGYHLGAFRGYDQYWKAWTIQELDCIGTEYIDPLVFSLYIRPITSKMAQYPDPTPSVAHTFKIEFARVYEDFAQGLATVISSNFQVVNTSNSFQFNAQNPPDYATKGALAIGATYYIKVTHLSSDDRRWVDSTPVPNGIFTFTVPNTAYTNTKLLQSFSAVAVKQITPSVYKNVIMSADLYADLSAPATVTIKYEIASNSSFSSNYNSNTITVDVPKNSGNPGTQTLVQNVQLDFQNDPIFQTLGKGDTVYCRFQLNGVIQGSYISTIITDVLPQ